MKCLEGTVNFINARARINKLHARATFGRLPKTSVSGCNVGGLRPPAQGQYILVPKVGPFGRPCGNNDTHINAELSESVIGMNEVVVQASRPMIQTDVTYSQANISSEEVEMLPVEEFEDVLALQAGVVSTGGEIHVRGG